MKSTTAGHWSKKKVVDTTLRDLLLQDLKHPQNCKYLIFGSPSSVDIDTLVLIPENFDVTAIPPDQFGYICEQLVQPLQIHFADPRNRKVNVNLGRLNNDCLNW